MASAEAGQRRREQRLEAAAVAGCLPPVYMCTGQPSGAPTCCRCDWLLHAMMSPLLPYVCAGPHHLGLQAIVPKQVWYTVRLRSWGGVCEAAGGGGQGGRCGVRQSFFLLLPVCNRLYNKE